MYRGNYYSFTLCDASYFSLSALLHFNEADAATKGNTVIVKETPKHQVAKQYTNQTPKTKMAFNQHK